MSKPSKRAIAAARQQIEDTVTVRLAPLFVRGRESMMALLERHLRELRRQQAQARRKAEAAEERLFGRQT